MARLLDLMLDIARSVGIAREGTTSATGTTTSIVDANLRAPAETYQGGTLFILSGTYDGAVKVITQHGSGGKITFSGAVAGAVPSGVSYAVTLPKYPYHLLRQTAIRAIQKRTITMHDDTLVTVANQEEYTLPAGVGDVRKVLISSNTSDPHDFQPSFFWSVSEGKLIFTSPPSTAGMVIRLVYAGKHASIADGADIDQAVDYEYALWAGVVDIYRWMMNNTGKDNPEIVELLNEAKVNEDMAAGRAASVPARAPIHAKW